MRKKFFNTNLPATNWKRENALAGLFGGSYSTELLLFASHNGIVRKLKDKNGISFPDSEGKIVPAKAGNPTLVQRGDLYYLGVASNRLNFDQLPLASKFESNLYLINAIIKGDFDKFHALIQTIYSTNQKDAEILEFATLLAAEKTDPRFMKELLDRNVPLHPSALSTAQAIAQETGVYATVDYTLARCCFDVSLPRRLDGQRQNLPSKEDIKQHCGNSLYQTFIESPHKALYASVRVAGVIALGATLPATTSLALVGAAAAGYCLSDATTQIKAEYTIKTDIKAICDTVFNGVKGFVSMVTPAHNPQPAAAVVEGRHNQRRRPTSAEGYQQQRGGYAAQVRQQQDARNAEAYALNDLPLPL